MQCNERQCRAPIFRITKTELYVPVVTLNTDSKKKLSDLLKKGLKRSVFWNEYKSKIEQVTTMVNNNDVYRRILLDSSFQGVNSLFAMGLNNAIAATTRVLRESHKIYFLLRVSIKDNNILIDGRNFYNQTINDEIRMYDEVRKIALGKGDDYTTGCLLDFQYFKDHDKLAACDLSKQAILYSDLRSAQQIEFTYKLDDNVSALILTILEKEKETILELSIGTVKVL